MNNHFTERNLSPGAVASLTQPTTDLQRNYRARGMFDGIGEPDEAGRWKYSLRDVVAIWIGDRLHMNGLGMDRRDALRNGNALADTVITRFLRRHAGVKDGTARYVVTVADGHAQEGKTSGLTFLRTSDLASLAERAFDALTVLDCERLAATIPANIAGLLTVALENQYDDMGLDALTEGLDA